MTSHLTWDDSRVCHIEAAISGERANADRVIKISDFSGRGIGHPMRPNSEATGNQDWFSYITTRAFSSCIDR